jgi:hypothetical protein
MTKAGGGLAGLIVLACVLAASGFAWGQTAAPLSGITTIHVLSDLIEVPVLALKPPFRPAPALSQNDFVIRLDGGPPFHPSHARIEDAEPLALTVLVEADVRDSSLLAQGLQAAIQGWPPNLLNRSDRLSVDAYGCRLVRSLRDERVDFQLRRDEIARAMALPTFRAAMDGGRSCLRPAVDEMLEAAIDQMAGTASWKVILLIVNGEYKADAKSLQKVQTLAAAKGVTLFAIKYLHEGIFPAAVNSDTEGVNLLVSSLGGIMLPSSFDDLGAVTETIINDIRQRYILSFPRPGNGSAGAHRLEITSTAKGVRVLSSAAAAPLFDSTRCVSEPDSWFCSEQRPRYGTDNQQR